MARMQIPAKPIEVVYLGDEHLGEARGNVVEPTHPPMSPFVLSVGVLDARKNHYALYHVWRKLAAELGEDCPRLVLIGRRLMLSDDLLWQINSDPIVNKLIVHLQDVPDAELAWYFRNCLFTMFPSHYEGWGLPVAESLSHGKLCIASNASSIPEIGGDLVDYFDPTDIASCYRLTHRAVTDEGYREERENEIKLRYTARSWSAAAETVNRIVDDLQRCR
jgi:glycosyltransferase involved in cell wall biosynthesis